MTTPNPSVEVNVDEGLSGNIETPKEESKPGWVKCKQLRKKMIMACKILFVDVIFIV